MTRQGKGCDAREVARRSLIIGWNRFAAKSPVATTEANRTTETIRVCKISGSRNSEWKARQRGRNKILELFGTVRLINCESQRGQEEQYCLRFWPHLLWDGSHGANVIRLPSTDLNARRVRKRLNCCLPKTKFATEERKSWHCVGTNYKHNIVNCVMIWTLLESQLHHHQ